MIRPSLILRGLAANRRGGPEPVDVQNDGLKPENAVNSLTDKQRQVLDLLIEHKTSKEIARELGISPHTVDQRLQFAKEKLGARSRSELAQAYRRLLEVYGQLTYEPSGIADPLRKTDERDGAQGPLSQSVQSAAEADFQVGPELFEGRYGTLVRLGWMLGVAVLLVFVVIGTLALYEQIAEFWHR
jgi:DNA-binding CsgD family transcriptional regulator